MQAPAKYQLLRCPALLLPLVFLGLGLAVLPQPGIEDDEVLFAAPILHLPDAANFSVHVFHKQLPLMLLSYLGALKSWLYFPIFASAPPSVLTVRLPVLVIGSLTVLIFVWLLERTGGGIIAWFGGLLLATDTMFLFTTCFDWGPVALQHFLAMAGIALLWKFVTAGSRWALWGGFFCFRAGSVGQGAVCVAVQRADRRHDRDISARALVAVAVRGTSAWPRAGLCLGALPLLAYNAASNLATFRSNASFNLAQLPSRLHALRITWDGQILWGYMVHAPWSPGAPRAAATVLDWISGAVHSAGWLPVSQ